MCIYSVTFLSIFLSFFLQFFLTLSLSSIYWVGQKVHLGFIQYLSSIGYLSDPRFSLFYLCLWCFDTYHSKLKLFDWYLFSKIIMTHFFVCLFFVFFWLSLEECGILVPSSRIELVFPAVGAWSLYYRTTREVW